MRCLLVAGLAVLVATPAVAARTVCWKSTSLMWDAAAGRAVPVSPEMRRRLASAFASWEKASGGALRFRDEGHDAPGHDSTVGIARDGCVHAVLHGERNFGDEVAHGRFDGEVPDAFERGYFFVSRKAGADDLDTLVHEIGHALGLPHAATPASIMFSGTRTAGDAPTALGRQDAADIRARWVPDAPNVFTIEGTIESGRDFPTANVFAVPEGGGRSWSARADHRGRFLIALTEPGAYRLVARPITEARDLQPDAMGGFRETWHPGVVELTAADPHARDVRLATLDDAVGPRPVAGPAPGGGPRRLDVPADPGPAPLLRLSFDRGFDPDGAALKSELHGDAVELVPGLRGRALFVGGTADWLDVPLGDEVKRLERGFTIEFWFRRDDWTNPYKGGAGWQTLVALTTDATLAVTAPGCPLHEPWALEAHLSGNGPDGESDSVRAFTAPGLVAAGRWHHAAMVHDPADGSVVVYLDGAQTGRSLGAPVPAFGFRKLRVGTWYETNQAYRGAIDELVVYDVPRPASAVAAAAAAAR